MRWELVCLLVLGARLVVSENPAAIIWGTDGTRRVKQGLGPVGTSFPDLSSVPDHSTVPWRCEAVPTFGRQRWYSEQQVALQAAEGRQLGASRELEAGVQQQQQQQHNSSDPGVGPDHPHVKVCGWLKKHFAGRSNFTSAVGNYSTLLTAAAGAAPGAASRKLALGGAPPTSSSRGGRRTAAAATARPSWLWWRRQLVAPAEPPAPEPQGPPKRDFLVVAPIGPAFDATKWLDQPEQATWDLIGIYYGYDSSYTCERCKQVYAGQGPKWRLMYALYTHPDWPRIARQYKAIMVADENVGLSTQLVNKAFAVMDKYKLLLAQPSICQGAFATDAVLKQQPEFVVRYTTFVQIMAPMFQMDFFDSMVGQTLYNAYAGTALDYVWPYLLRYPPDEIGIIDAVCVSHIDWGAIRQMVLPRYPTWAPYGAEEEELRRFAEWGYYASSVSSLTGSQLYDERMPFPTRFVQVLGAVPDRSYAPPRRSSGRCDALLGAVFGVSAFCTALWWHRKQRKVKL